MKCDLNPLESSNITFPYHYRFSYNGRNDDNWGRTKEQDSRMTDLA